MTDLTLYLSFRVYICADNDSTSAAMSSQN